ncbi:hypothetical protein [Streptomyces sp. NPDC050485]|uniref:hypothetical protein n=1 Tax=Streptomyces sp. NPDC050485 TaxID=3365617 RepID=UPI003796B846
MKTYQVEVFQSATYRVEIEAENEDLAMEAAFDLWHNVPASEEHKYLHDIVDCLVDRASAKEDA